MSTGSKACDVCPAALQTIVERITLLDGVRGIPRAAVGLVAVVITVTGVTPAGASDRVSDLYCSAASPAVSVGDPEGLRSPACYVAAGETNSARLSTTRMAEPGSTFYFLELSGLPARWDATSLTPSGEGTTWQIVEHGRVLIVDAAGAAQGLPKVLLASNDVGVVDVSVYRSTATAIGLVNTNRMRDTVVNIHAVIPTITVLGVERDGRRILIRGLAEGLPVDATLVPHVRTQSQAAFAPGVAQLRVAPDGSFTWTRDLTKKALVYFATINGQVTSNMVEVPGLARLARITIQAR